MLHKLAAIRQHYFHLFLKYLDKFGYEKTCTKSQQFVGWEVSVLFINSKLLLYFMILHL